MPLRPPIDPQGTYHVGSRGTYGRTLFRTPGRTPAVSRALRQSGQEVRMAHAGLDAHEEPPSLRRRAHARWPLRRNAGAARRLLTKDPCCVRTDSQRPSVPTRVLRQAAGRRARRGRCLRIRRSQPVQESLASRPKEGRLVQLRRNARAREASAVPSTREAPTAIRFGQCLLANGVSPAHTRNARGPRREILAKRRCQIRDVIRSQV